MNDFETHPRGTAKELRLSRELAREIHEQIEQHGEIFPEPVRIAFNKLYGHYIYSIQSEEL